MATHQHTGKKGEDLAVLYLSGKGFKLLHRNWRYRHWEIDIIAFKDSILHFIEIKTRTSAVYGYPEEQITQKKMQYLINAATEYLFQHPKWQRIQYDALAIIIIGEEVEYFFIEDIYL